MSKQVAYTAGHCHLLLIIGNGIYPRFIPLHDIIQLFREYQPQDGKQYRFQPTLKVSDHLI
jgi:hypothetical protein